MIRISLGLSQRGLIRQMGLQEELSQAEISMFESGRRIPSLFEQPLGAHVPSSNCVAYPVMKKSISEERNGGGSEARVFHLVWSRRT